MSRSWWRQQLHHYRLLHCLCDRECSGAAAPAGSDHRRACRRLRQYRLYGSGTGASTLGPQAAAPVALIFCFDSIVLFSLVPFLMEIGGGERRGFWRSVLFVGKRIALHPFIIATVLGVMSAALHFEPPVALDRLMQFLQNAAAPCALFVLGRHGRAAAVAEARLGRAGRSFRSSSSCIR